MFTQWRRQKFSLGYLKKLGNFCKKKFFFSIVGIMYVKEKDHRGSIPHISPRFYARMYTYNKYMFLTKIDL